MHVAQLEICMHDCSLQQTEVDLDIEHCDALDIRDAEHFPLTGSQGAPPDLLIPRPSLERVIVYQFVCIVVLCRRHLQRARGEEE